MLEHILDPGFLGALAAWIGPLAVFVAPTEEIEAMIFDVDADDITEAPVAAPAVGVLSGPPVPQTGLSEAA